MKVFVSWSGGKETALAFYRAARNEDIEAAGLLNMVSADGQHCCSHGVHPDLVRRQAEALGIPLIQKRAAWETYEAEFKQGIAGMKQAGMQAGIFGDIDIREHRDWVERVCREEKVDALLPLWQEERARLLEEFITAGFKAVVVVTNGAYMGREFLGREIDREFIRDIEAAGNIDLCGEKGEYHTFVYDGPIFKRPVKFDPGRKTERDNYHFLELV